MMDNQEESAKQKRREKILARANGLPEEEESVEEKGE